MRRLDETGIPLLLARIIVGVMFIIMGAHKAGDPVAFLKLIRLYDMVPDTMPTLLNAMAILLPWVEIVCGFLLVAGIAVRGSSLLLLGMLAVFTVAVFMRAWGIYQAGNTGGQILAFCSIKFDCGCGSGEVYTCRKIPENVTLMLLSLVALLSRSDRYCAWRNLIPANKLPWNIEGY